MSRFSISTSWNALKWIEREPPPARAEMLVNELKELGFDKIELSFNLGADIVKGIKQLVKEGVIKVSSLHNICPIPDGVMLQEASPDYYSLASLDEAERALAIKYTRRTIETAYELNASAVVLHAGRVEITGSRKAFEELYEKGLRGTQEYTAIANEMAEERSRLKPRYLAQVLRSLEGLAKFADASGVKLGIETRMYFREIPSFEEIGTILDKFSGVDSLGYWHDTGHAQYIETLGFGRHKDFLDAYSEKMIGIHLHDIKGTHDHLAPGTGELDFSMLKPCLKEGIIEVLEPHKPASAEQVMEGTRYLERVLS